MNKASGRPANRAWPDRVRLNLAKRMASADQSRRFVVLRHTMPEGSPREDHWDLMVEAEGGLWTWAWLRLPTASESMLARRLPDHRPLYLEYEGPVSENRGEVRRWDSGCCEVLGDVETQLTLNLNGKQLRGTLRLCKRVGGDSNEYEASWKPRGAEASSWEETG